MRHDVRLWIPHLRQVFPNLDPTIPVSDLREAFHNDLEAIRLLRNRIAHHEPIFTKNLAGEYQRVIRLVEGRCLVTAGWMQTNCANVPKLLANRP